MAPRLEMILMRSLGISYVKARSLVHDARQSLDLDVTASNWTEELLAKCEEIHNYPKMYAISAGATTKTEEDESESISSHVNNKVILSSPTPGDHDLPPFAWDEEKFESHMNEITSMQHDNIRSSMTSSNWTKISGTDDESDHDDDRDDDNSDNDGGSMDSTIFSCEPFHDDGSWGAPSTLRESTCMSVEEMMQPEDVSELFHSLDHSGDDDDNDEEVDLFDPKQQHSHQQQQRKQQKLVNPIDAAATWEKIEKLTAKLEFSSPTKSPKKIIKKHPKTIDKENDKPPSATAIPTTPKSKIVMKKKSKGPLHDNIDSNHIESPDIPEYVFVITNDNLPIRSYVDEAKQYKIEVRRHQQSDSDFQAFHILTLSSSRVISEVSSHEPVTRMIRKVRSRSIGARSRGARSTGVKSTGGTKRHIVAAAAASSRAGGPTVIDLAEAAATVHANPKPNVIAVPKRQIQKLRRSRSCGTKSRRKSLENPQGVSHPVSSTNTKQDADEPNTKSTTRRESKQMNDNRIVVATREITKEVIASTAGLRPYQRSRSFSNTKQDKEGLVVLSKQIDIDDSDMESIRTNETDASNVRRRRSLSRGSLLRQPRHNSFHNGTGKRYLNVGSEEDNDDDDDDDDDGLEENGINVTSIV